MKLKIISVLLILSFSCKLQGQSLDSEYLELISKNILSFHIRYAMNYDLNLKSDVVLNNGEYFFNKLWPENGENLKLDVLLNNLKYPIERFTLYEINKKGFQIGNDSLRTFHKLNSFRADDIYLVAVDSINREMLFLSGNFFHTSIKENFDLNVDIPNSFIFYLVLKTFNWSTINIKFKKKLKDEIVFSAFSQILNKDIQIIVDKYDFDKISIKEREKRYVY